MFELTLYDKFKQKGLSVDSIAPEMRNRFNARFNNPEIDNRLQVRLDEKAIRFFFYDASDMKTILEDRYKEVATVSLTYRKETGQDVLYLKKQIVAKSGSLNSVKNVDWKRVCDSLLGDGSLWHGFPFADKYKGAAMSKVKGFAFFVQCCFLFFVDEFENRDSAFSYSPIYDSVREKLRASVVYKLLCAKIKYSVYLCHGESSYSEDEYTFLTQRFADLLMDRNINKIVPPYYYQDTLWFYNPEEELDLVVHKNNLVRERRGEARLNPKLQDKIRDYFFARHAILSAMGTRLAKALYGGYIVIVGLFSVFATYGLLFFDDLDDPVVNFFFNKIIVWDVLAAVSLLFLIVLACAKGVNVLMPRVLVAMGIGWLTAFISEDLVKSQLEIGPVFTGVAFGGVMLLVTAMLFSEAKQHSPYYVLGLDGFFKSHLRYLFKFSSHWKLAPILIHSYFWALTIGVVMQFALYDDLLKNSNALPEIVYKSNFDEAGNYVMSLNNFKSALEDYQVDWDNRFVKATVTGIMTTAQSAGFIDAKMDYTDNEIQKMKARDLMKREVINTQFHQVCKIESEVASKTLMSFYTNDFVADRRAEYMNYVTIGGASITEFYNLIDELSKHETEFKPGISAKKFDRIVGHQLDVLDTLISLVDGEIQDVEIFVSQNNNYDTLIAWSTQRDDYHGEMVDYCDYIKYKVSHQYDLCRNVDMVWVDSKPVFVKKEMHLFPRMLIFHSLIVLIIAFVGQLIVSDKSVTEPL